MGLSDIKTYMIGLVLFVLVIGGGVFMLGSFRASNPTIDVSRVESFNATFNMASNVTTAVNNIGDSIATTESKPGVLGWFNVLFGSAWNGLKLLSGSLGFVKVAIMSIADMFGVPPSVAILITLIPILIIVFAIWGAIIQAQD